MKTPEAQARDAFLHSGYGKFDFVIDIIPKELLLFGKPRRIKEWLVKSLQLDNVEVNDNTLRSWLYRYRKSQNQMTQPLETADWKSFEPTLVKSEIDDRTLIIKKVTYKI